SGRQSAVSDCRGGLQVASAADTLLTAEGAAPRPRVVIIGPPTARWPQRSIRRESAQDTAVSLPLFLQGLGSIGVFASRAFLPAFVTAVLLRFGPHAPWLTHAGLIPHIRAVPTWFTSDTSLVILGVLAALEIIAERFPEAAAILAEVHDYLK